MGAREFGDDLLRGLLEHTTRSLPGAVGAGLLVTEQVETVERRRGRARGRPATPTVSTVMRVAAAVGVASVLDPAQAQGGVGPAWEAEPDRAVALVPSPAELARWSALGPATPDGLGVGGVLLLPAEPLWGNVIPGARVRVSAYLDRAPKDGDVAVLQTAEPLLGRALGMVEFALAEELKAEQMLQMIQYRRVIEQAKGLVLAAVGGDAPSAFTTLSRASQHFNVRLRNLAVALVEYVGDGPAEQPDDPEQLIVPGEADRHAAVQVWAALTARPVPPDAAPEPAAGPGARPVEELVPEPDAEPQWAEDGAPQRPH